MAVKDIKAGTVNFAAVAMDNSCLECEGLHCIGTNFVAGIAVHRIATNTRIAFVNFAYFHTLVSYTYLCCFLIILPAVPPNIIDTLQV